MREDRKEGRTEGFDLVRCIAYRYFRCESRRQKHFRGKPRVFCSPVRDRNYSDYARKSHSDIYESLLLKVIP